MSQTSSAPRRSRTRATRSTSCRAARPQGIAHPGKVWQKVLDVPKNAKVEIEDAPAGTRYDAASRTLIWNVAATEKTGLREILLLVNIPDRDEEYLTIQVPVE